MPRFDLPLDQLEAFRPPVDEPEDFDAFWTQTVDGARRLGRAPTVVAVDSGLTEVDVFDVTFSGFAGDPINGWWLTPRGGRNDLPVVVEYLGYGGGRGFPHERLAWVGAGYAYFVMDSRGQGSVWGSGGDTADPHGAGPAAPGFMTRGIEDPADYYYRRLYTDALRAIDTVQNLDRADKARIAVCGASQGGGVALAVAGLVPELIGVMPDVPFLSHFRRAVELSDREPYAELVRYLSVHRQSEARAFSTLAYFDGVNFAKRARCPALFSVALMDPVCPPSTVFASFNHYLGDADIEVYGFNEHEGGGGQHWRKQARWLDAIVSKREPGGARPRPGGDSQHDS